MSEVPFSRLFSMPAFEGLRVFRMYMTANPTSSEEEILARMRRAEAGFRSYDIHAALALHVVVNKAAPPEGVGFYRECIAAILIDAFPEWAKLITLGRGRFIKRLEAQDLRDFGSLFRQARLLDDPPDIADVKWWDDLQAHVRTQKGAQAMDRARTAERLTLERENAILEQLGIQQRAVWVAIEDNTVGYDVLSYTPGQFGPLNKLIEVKSTIASPVRFYLTSNEWKQALKYGDAYVFHVWNLLAVQQVLHELSVDQVAPHVPKNFEKGTWETALIPVSI